MTLGWLWAAIARVATALWDRLRAEVNARRLGEAAERERALRAAEEAERLAREAAEKAKSEPVDQDDGWARD